MQSAQLHIVRAFTCIMYLNKIRKFISFAITTTRDQIDMREIANLYPCSCTTVCVSVCVLLLLTRKLQMWWKSFCFIYSLHLHLHVERTNLIALDECNMKCWAVHALAKNSILIVVAAYAVAASASLVVQMQICKQKPNGNFLAGYIRMNAKHAKHI